MMGPKPTIGGNENPSGRLFKVSSVRGELEKKMAVCLK